MPYCLFWMGGFLEERNREKRDWREMFNLSCLGAVQEKGGKFFLCVGPTEKISSPQARLSYRKEEVCVFSTYYASLID